MNKKENQLGINPGTAAGQLRKKILFDFVKKAKLDICFHCKGTIENDNELSIEHKIPWLDSEKPKDLFFDLDNIAFSHLKCNSAAGRKVHKKYLTEQDKNISQIQHQRNWRLRHKDEYSKIRKEKYKRLGT